MSKITQNTLHNKMPIAELHNSLRTFAAPVATREAVATLTPA